MARRQSTTPGEARVPGSHQDTAVVRIATQLVDAVLQLVDFAMNDDFVVEVLIGINARNNLIPLGFVLFHQTTVNHLRVLPVTPLWTVTTRTDVSIQQRVRRHLEFIKADPQLLDLIVVDVGLDELSAAPDR
ncbi:hypothetical protein D3C86_1826400 [compost metagenome]